MPNWCDNVLVIENLVQGEIQELEQAARSENFCEFIAPSPDWNNTPNEDGELPVVDQRFQGVSWWSDGEQDLRWLDWNNENWGSKWGDCEGSVESSKEAGTLTYDFQTAWSPLNENFLRALSLKYPQSLITLKHLESGNDFIGATIARNGRVIDECLDFSSLEEGWFEASHNGEVMDEDEREECWCDEMDEFGWEFLGGLSARLG